MLLLKAEPCLIKASWVDPGNLALMLKILLDASQTLKFIIKYINYTMV